MTVEIPYSNCTSGTVASLVQKDGTREVVRTSVADPDTGRVCLTLDGPAQVEIQENAKSFNDVGSNAWFADAVAFVCSHELMQGTGTGTFAPNAVTTRAAIAMMLYNLEKNPAVGGPAFTDTKAGAWYTDAITWASENKLVNGYGKGIFGPDDAITREQMAVILYNYAVYRGLNVQQQGSLGAFQDSASVSNWATTALRWAVSEGLVNGDDGGNLNPGGSATRAQVATVLMRFCDVLVP